MGISVDVECPCCGHYNEVEIEDIDSGSMTTECADCGISMEFQYSVSVEVEDVTVSDIPAVDITCPQCNDIVTLDHIDDESGSTEIECDNCGSLLEVFWSKCGQEYDVKLLEEGEKDDDDNDEDDDDDEDEDDDDEDVDYDDKDEGYNDEDEEYL